MKLLKDTWGSKKLQLFNVDNVHLTGKWANESWICGDFQHPGSILGDLLAKTPIASINQERTSELPGSRQYNYYVCPGITMEL